MDAVGEILTHLDNADIRLLARLVHWNSRNSFNPILHGVCQMRDNLNRFPEVVAPTFLFNHMGIDFAGGDIVVPGEGDVEVSLVVSEIEVGFAAVVEHVHFT